MGSLGGVRATALVQRIREAANMEGSQAGSQFVTDTEIRRRIDESATDLYDKLITNLGEDYFVKTQIIPHPVAGTGPVPLPADFYRLCSVHMAKPRPGGSGAVFDYTDMVPFQRGDITALINSPQTDAGPYRYRLVADRYRITVLGYTSTTLNDYLEVYPLRFTPGNLRISYVPRLDRYDDVSEFANVNDTDPIYPGINGWEEYVVLSVAIRLLAKEESDTSDLRAERDRIEARIEALKSRRDVGRPAMVVRTRKRGGNALWRRSGQ